MAVSKKGLRKVNYKGRQYLWHVNEADAWLPEQGFVETGKVRVLHIISSNKQFIIHYRLPQPGEPHARLRVEGPSFPRQPGAKEITVPRWKHDSKPYPTADFVRRLIAWCMGEEGGDC
jgi:hypothetical protein